MHHWPQLSVVHSKLGLLVALQQVTSVDSCSLQSGNLTPNLRVERGHSASAATMNGHTRSLSVLAHAEPVASHTAGGVVPD